MIDPETDKILKIYGEHQELIDQLALVGVLAILGLMRDPDPLERDADNTSALVYRKDNKCLLEDVTPDEDGHGNSDFLFPYVLGRPMITDLRSRQSIIAQKWPDIATALKELDRKALPEIIERRNNEQYYEQLPDRIQDDVKKVVLTAQPHEEK